MTTSTLRDTARRAVCTVLASVTTVIAVAILLAGCGPAADPSSAPEGRVDELTFAETWEFWTAPTLVADLLDLYEEVGLEVKVAKFPTGLAAKNAVLTHSADLGLVAVTPVANAGFRGEEITLIATYFESDVIVKLVTRGAGPEPAPEFMVDRRVGYIPGTISEIVLERMVEKYGLERERIRTASLRPTELVQALENGDIDAFVAWEPFPLFAERRLGEEVGLFVDPELYTVSLHLVTRPDVIAAKGAALRKFLEGLDHAVERIRERPEEARRLVEDSLDFQPDELAGVWGELRFMVTLDRPALLRRLRQDAEWLVEAGYERGRIPSYEDYVEPSVYEAFREERGAALGTGRPAS